MLVRSLSFLRFGLVSSLASLAGANAQQDGPVTFTEHVAPIVFERCASCHRPGEAAPFSLLTYAECRKRARMIARVTERRDMPPWHPVAGHGEFEGAMRLTDDEIETLAAWVRGGRLEGDPSALPPPPEFTAGWQLGEPDLVVTMAEGFEVPAGGPDIYRNFAVPLDLDGDRWLTAIEVRPGARGVLHHVIFGLDPTRRSRERDGADGKPGWDGMRGGGRANLGTSTAGLGGWAVGGMPQHLPLGLARKIPQGADLILRSHFHPSGKAEVERTTVGLYFTDEPPSREMVGLQMPPMFGVAAGLDVPAGDANFELRDEFTLPVDALAVTVGGHAHYICTEMQVVVTRPDEEAESVFWIDDWDFNWQNRYQYARPVELPKGTRVATTLRYDNSDANPNNPNDPPRRIRWGLQSTDEMGSVTLLLVAKSASDTGKLERAVRQHRRDGMRGQAARRGFGASLVSRLRMGDANGDGKLEPDEVPERLRRFFDRADRNGDGALDADELDALADSLGRRRE